MKKIAGTLLLVGLGWAVQAQAKSASEVFEAVSPSVVVIKSFDAKGKQVSLGSGVALSADEVATNCHVLKDGKNFRIVYQGKEYQAKARHSDWQRDVCSLAAHGLDARPATLGATGKLKVGQKVFAVGAPQGLALSLSDGLVSSLRPVVGGQYLQITAPISPGSSGGGLFDDEGSLIGLPTFYLTEGQQLNFAVPVEWIKELSNDTRLPPTLKRPRREPSLRSPAPPTTTDWINKATAFEGKKDWPGLKTHALRWTKAEPGNSLAWIILGDACGKLSQPTKEIEAYQQAVRIDPEIAMAWYILGDAYIINHQPIKAIEAYQQAVRIDPKYADAWRQMGRAYFISAQFSKAIEALENSIRINPEGASTWFSLAIAYSELGQTAKADEAYQQSLRIDPEYANKLQKMGKANEQPIQSATDWFDKADDLQKKKNWKGLRDHALSWTKEEPGDSMAWYNLGLGYYYADPKQYTKAIEAYQQAIRINPDYADTWYDIGNAYLVTKQYTKAIEAYQQAIRINPDYASTWYNLGLAYADTNQDANAIEAYQQAVRINPKFAEAWFNLGITYKVSGQAGKVIEVYKRLKAIDPDRADDFFSKIVMK